MKTSETRKVEAYSLSIFRSLLFMLKRYFINPLRYLDLTLGLCNMGQICTIVLFCHLSLDLSQKKLFVDSGCMYILTVCMYIIYYTHYQAFLILPICTSQQLLKTHLFFHQDTGESFQEQHILIHGCSTLHLSFKDILVMEEIPNNHLDLV